MTSLLELDGSDSMKYILDVEKSGSLAARLIHLAICCAAAGACVGMVIAAFGYAPNPIFPELLVAGVVVGGIAGGILGPILCYILFGQKLTNRIFYSVVFVASVVGAIGALVFRFLTGGGGAWLGVLPSMVTTVIAGLWFRFSNSAHTSRH
jgi:hypothetical protein